MKTNQPGSIRIIQNRGIWFNQNPILPELGSLSPDVLYKQLGCHYPKFYKMDLTCKWGFLAASLLFDYSGSLPSENTLPEASGIILHSEKGCLSADKRFQESIAYIASPALFVYTLPNILLGEWSIRFQMKGFQLSGMFPAFCPSRIWQDIEAAFNDYDMQSVLAGWVNIDEHTVDIWLTWLQRSNWHQTGPEWIETHFNL